MTPMALLLNLLWLLFGGVWMAVAWGVAAVIMAITIVGLPWARAAFNIGIYTLLPFGMFWSPSCLPSPLSASHSHGRTSSSLALHSGPSAKSSCPRRMLRLNTLGRDRNDAYEQRRKAGGYISSLCLLRARCSCCRTRILGGERAQPAARHAQAQVQAPFSLSTG